MRTLCLAAAVLALGCASRGAPVAVEGATPDVARLVGDWAGDFEGVNGRAGTIHFHLAGLGDTAWGDLQMVPEMPPPDPSVEGRPTLMEAPLVLSIRFVQIAENRVRGMLEPYRDPVCGCRITTVFEGTLRGDVIVGEYVTRHLEHPREVRGTWRVTRLVRR